MVTAHREKIESVPFTVRARVAMQLGRESISSSIVAIIELVKNAYDADAADVRVQFNELGTSNANLEIIDNGSGMTFEQLRNRWMVIGTDNKAQTRKSKTSRVMVGEKGLGRLGLDRLATHTIVSSFSQEIDYGIELDIEWEKYEQHSHDALHEIKHDIYRIEKSNFHGTAITMLNLRDEWDQPMLSALEKDLLLLVSPFGQHDDFRIWLSINGVEKRIESSVFELAEWTLEGELYQSNPQTWFVKKRLSGLKDSEESVIWRDSVGRPVPACGPVQFTMYFFSRDNAFTKSQKKNFLEANQGIRIYRDGFRVQPYGDPEASGEGDWLGLNMRRVRHPSGVVQEGHWNVGYNQVVGAVFISREHNPDLKDQTNREGLTEGLPLAHLRKFAMDCVYYFEQQRQIYERSRDPDPLQKAKVISRQTSSNIGNAREKMRTSLNTFKEKQARGEDTDQALEVLTVDINKLEEAIESEQQALEELEKAYEANQKEFEAKQDTLSNLASLGILAATFGHETVNTSTLIVTNADLLTEEWLDVEHLIPEEKNVSITEEIDIISKGATYLQTFAKFTLGNVRSDKRLRRKTNLVRIANTVGDVFDFNRRDIEFVVEPKKDKEIPHIMAFAIDWESIFINLLTNSFTALDPIDDKTRRKIHLKFEVKDNDLHITFDDGGIGIEPGTIDLIFEPTYSTRRNHRGDIVGTGMGLSIVQQLVQNYKGRINAQYHGTLGGARFEIVIPLTTIKDAQ